MITEEVKEARETCKPEKELKPVNDLHKSEEEKNTLEKLKSEDQVTLSDEETDKVAGGNNQSGNCQIYVGPQFSGTILFTGHSPN